MTGAMHEGRVGRRSPAHGGGGVGPGRSRPDAAIRGVRPVRPSGRSSRRRERSEAPAGHDTGSRHHLLQWMRVGFDRRDPIALRDRGISVDRCAGVEVASDDAEPLQVGEHRALARGARQLRRSYAGVARVWETMSPTA